MKLSLAGYKILGWNFFAISMLKIGPQSPLTCKVSSSKSADEASLMKDDRLCGGTWGPFSSAAVLLFLGEAPGMKGCPPGTAEPGPDLN